MASTYRMLLKCVDDNTEWDFEITPGSEDALIQHQIFASIPEDAKALEMENMKCPSCHKSSGHEATRAMVEE